MTIGRNIFRSTIIQSIDPDTFLLSVHLPPPPPPPPPPTPVIMSLLRFSENGTAYEPQLAELSWNYSIGRIAVSLVNSFKQQP